MLDTGATISLVATRLVHMLGLTNNIKPTSKMIIGLSKKIVPMRGEIELTIRIGERILSHVFIVSDQIDNEFLLGTDVMNKFDMQLDFRRKVVTVFKAEVSFKPKPQVIPRRMKIRLQKNVIIPANTAMFISGKIDMKNGNVDIIDAKTW